MSIIHTAIEINTEITGSSDLSIGLTTDGYIRLITDRPDYDGNPTYPVWEDDSNNTKIWFEGILLNKKFSSPHKSIDIEKGGNYGNVTGFSFQIHNIMKFWNIIESLDISILNNDINVYCVIDNKFYACWSGIIEDDQYNDTSTKIKCGSNIRKNHKPFPPSQISPTLFPKAKKSSYGNIIPVSVGNIPYAQLFSTTGNNTDLPLDFASGKYHFGNNKVLPKDIIYSVGCVEYNSSISRFWFVTVRKSFIENELQNFYLTCKSGENAETEKLIQIVSNTASVFIPTGEIYLTRLKLASLYDINDTVFNANYTYNQATTKDSVDKTWWFGIINANSQHLVSNFEVYGFKNDKFKQPIMYNYNREKEIMEDAHGLVTKITSKDNRNYVNLLSTDINKDGTIIYMVPHGSSFKVLDDNNNFLFLDFQELASDMHKTTDTSNILDDDETLTITTSHTPTNPYILENHVFDLDLTNFDLRDSEDIYIGIDLDVYTNSLVASKKVGIGFEFILIDLYEYPQKLTTNMGIQYTYELNSTSFFDPLRWNFLPTEYYKNGTLGLAGSDSIFGEIDDDDNQVKSYLKLPDELKEMLKKKLARAVRIRIKISSTENLTIDEIYIRQLGVFSYQKTKTGNNALFVTIDGGEKRNLSGDSTHGVYDTVRHILENYDKLLFANIDYDNLSSTRRWRHGWEIGRQITQQKNSIDYLRELCQFSFLGIFLKRNGELKVTAFRENQTVSQAFTSSNILKNSIKNFRKTSLLNCYNSFRLYFGYNPGSRKMERSIGITNIEQSSFPNYLDSNQGVSTEITSPNLVNILLYGDGSGKITFDADVSGILSIGDFITYYIWYGDSGIESSDHAYYAYVSSVETTIIKYQDALINTHSNAVQESTGATIYKNLSGTPLWMTFAEGFNSYGDGKKLWEACHYAYTKTKIAKNAPNNIMKSNWFIDSSIFYNSTSSVIPSNSAPFLYLQNLIEWTSLPKNQVNFSLPINSTFILLDLLDYVSFTDIIITNNVTVYGWITNIAIDLNNSKINIELTIKSTYADEMELILGNNIIETGSAPITITESGTQPDTITEGN